MEKKFTIHEAVLVKKSPEGTQLDIEWNGLTIPYTGKIKFYNRHTSEGDCGGVVDFDPTDTKGPFLFVKRDLEREEALDKLMEASAKRLRD